MWLTALILGVAGSIHCLGMCGPLMLAATVKNPSALQGRLIYNTGRIITYAILGAIVASFGLILPLSKYQNGLSILLGAALFAVAIGKSRSIHIPGVTAVLQPVTAKLKSLFGRYLSRKSKGAMFILGALNGLLPCGLTAVALAWCITLRGPVDGFNFMLIFGAGTLPAMLGLGSLLPILVKKFSLNLQKVTTALLILSGCILIARAFLVHLSHPSTGGGVLEIVVCQ